MKPQQRDLSSSHERDCPTPPHPNVQKHCKNQGKTQMVQKKCERAKNTVKTSANGQRQKTSLEETVVPAPPPGQHCREAENTVKNSTKCTFSCVSAREHPVGGNNNEHHFPSNNQRLLAGKFLHEMKTSAKTALLYSCCLGVFLPCD